MPTSESEEALLNLPEIPSEMTNPVIVNCTLTNSSFVQNTPSQINVTFTTQGNLDVTISDIEVQPISAVRLLETLNWDPNGTFYYTFEPTEIYPFNLQQITNGSYFQTWGNAYENWYGFQDTGPISLSIKVYMMPAINITVDSNFQAIYNTTLTFPSLVMRSETEILQQEETQQYYANQQILGNLSAQFQEQQVQLLTQEKALQASYQYMDWGLTSIIVFLGLLDVALVFFDNSKNEDRKAEYKKTNKKYDDISKQTQDYSI